MRKKREKDDRQKKREERVWEKKTVRRKSARDSHFP